MKKLLSCLIVLSMMFSLFAFVPAVSAAETTEEVENAEIIKKFGFSDDPNVYDKNTIQKGTHPISSKYNVYATCAKDADVQAWSTRKYVGTEEKVADSKNYTYKHSALTEEAEIGEYRVRERYMETVPFAATSSGIDDHYLEVYFDGVEDQNGLKGEGIKMNVYDAEGNREVQIYRTSAWVNTTDMIEMWELEGLLSATAGDYDGDGVDEIAVYTPCNTWETDSGATHNDLFITIYEYDVSTKKITQKQVIDITSKVDPSEKCEWEYSYNGKNKQFYCIPYVALSSNDLNGDGIDDLAAVVSFSTWFRGAGGKDKYTTKQILNHNTNFASVLEVYEGRKDSNLEQTIKHRVLVTNGIAAEDEDKSYRYILRNANITMGDVQQDGSNDIIIAGNYTRATVENTANDTTIVTSNRFVEVDGNHALCHIVGYTNYDNLKNHNTYDKNSEYNWTVQDTGNKYTFWYNEDNTDSAPITVSLAAFKLRGTGYPDTIFVGGQLFDCDPDTGLLTWTQDITGSEMEKGKNGSVKWIESAVAGNLSNDKFNRETLVFPYYYKISGEDKYYCRLISVAEGVSNKETGGVSEVTVSGRSGFDGEGTHTHLNLMLMDGDDKTSYIEYDGESADVYYSDVEALAILQAPPLYEELADDDYIGNSETSFEKSKGSGSEQTDSGTFSIGPIVGFEYNASIFGLVPAGGVDFETRLAISVTKEKSTSKSFNYATGFATSGTTDAVTVFTVPYVRYYCDMYIPEYKLPTKENYNELVAFKNELVANLEKYVKTGEEQIYGTYVKGCDYYKYKYSSYVCDANYQQQIGVLDTVTAEISLIQNAIAEFDMGGNGQWGDTVESAVIPHTYCVPQNPLLTTIDVATYDAIADYTPGLEKIYGTVFDETYRAGDPNTYAHSVNELKTNGDKVLEGKNTVDSDMSGYLTNSSLAAPGTSQSQTISVDEEDSSSLGWGLGLDVSFVVKGAVAKGGVGFTIDHNSSYVTTKTKGNEYSGTVVAFPAGTTADYTYDWKLVSYNSKLNGKKVPVVGYITRVQTLPPPSVAQNIAVEEVKDTSVTLTWEDGRRTPHYYKISRVAYDAANNEIYQPLGTVRATGGQYEFTVDNLQSGNTSHYIIESYYDGGKKSVASQKISVTTLPEGFAVLFVIDGVNENVIYRPGTNLTLNLNVSGNEKYDTYYQWQKYINDKWVNIEGQTGKTYNFDVSSENNNDRIRCTANIFIGNYAYKLYSNPVVLNCAREVDGYTVDWDDEAGTVTITSDEDAAPARAYVTTDAAGEIAYESKEITTEGAAFDVSSADDVKVYIWDENLAPITLPFVK